MTERGGKNVGNRNKAIVTRGFDEGHHNLLRKVMDTTKLVQDQSCQNVARHDNLQVLDQIDHDLQVQDVDCGNSIGSQFECESNGNVTPEIRDAQISGGKKTKFSKLTERMNVSLRATEVVHPPSTRQENDNDNQVYDQLVRNLRNGDSAHSVVDNTIPFGEVTGKVKQRGERGKFKSYVVDMKIKGNKSKLKINIPEDIDRAIGENARHFVNECGRVVRTLAPLNVETWREAFTQAGEMMLKEIEEKFEIKDGSTSAKMQTFAKDTMQRLYRLWKARLHSYYKDEATGANDDERAKNPPPDLPLDQWEYCVKRFGSSQFKKMSERNSKNRLSSKRTKHTTGPLSFAEVEDILTQENNGEKPTIDVCWLVEHTKKDNSGVLQWVDQSSKEIHDQLKVAVAIHGEPKTQEDILLHVLKSRPGYFRKGRHQFEHQVQQKKIQEHEERIRELGKRQENIQKQIEQMEQQLMQQREDMEAAMERMKQDLLCQFANT